MRKLIEPAQPLNARSTWRAILILLAVSAAVVFSAPLIMPDSYSWLSNYVSESAAQSVTGAWLARLGFLLFGFAVLWLANSLRSEWSGATYWCHLAFGLFMVSTAAFSHRPWLAYDRFDPLEDILHSVTSTAVGIAFSFGVLARLLQRQAGENAKRLFDCLALLAAIGLPLLGVNWPSVAGLAQRLMFLIAYAWYGQEVLSVAERDRNGAPG